MRMSAALGVAVTGMLLGCGGSTTTSSQTFAKDPVAKPAATEEPKLTKRSSIEPFPTGDDGEPRGEPEKPRPEETQPPKEAPVVGKPAEEAVVGGVEGGVLGGVEGGVGAMPPRGGPRLVPFVAIKGTMVRGALPIEPPLSVVKQMRRAGKARVVVATRLCLSERGRFVSVRVLRSSGYRAYDKRIVRKMRRWKFRPFKVDGKPIEVCTVPTLVFKDAPPSGPQVVTADELAALRRSGATAIKPPRDALKSMRRDGKQQVAAVVKACLRKSGKMRSVTVVKSSGYSRFDDRIRYLVRKWTHRPYKVDGKAAEVCSELRFEYTVEAAD